METVRVDESRLGCDTMSPEGLEITGHDPFLPRHRWGILAPPERSR
ncbi:MAG TPA: hypothetical protein VK920_03265 [Solirubrobacterales bacterium]|nr:hypothetical protein [Solirubrobacterales bacterium]